MATYDDRPGNIVRGPSPVKPKTVTPPPSKVVITESPSVKPKPVVKPQPKPKPVAKAAPKPLPPTKVIVPSAPKVAPKKISYAQPESQQKKALPVAKPVAARKIVQPRTYESPSVVRTSPTVRPGAVKPMPVKYKAGIVVSSGGAPAKTIVSGTGVKPYTVARIGIGGEKKLQIGGPTKKIGYIPKELPPDSMEDRALDRAWYAVRDRSNQLHTGVREGLKKGIAEATGPKKAMLMDELRTVREIDEVPQMTAPQLEGLLERLYNRQKATGGKAFDARLVGAVLKKYEEVRTQTNNDYFMTAHGTALRIAERIDSQLEAAKAEADRNNAIMASASAAVAKGMPYPIGLEDSLQHTEQMKYWKLIEKYRDVVESPEYKGVINEFYRLNGQVSIQGGGLIGMEGQAGYNPTEGSVTTFMNRYTEMRNTQEEFAGRTYSEALARADILRRPGAGFQGRGSAPGGAFMPDVPDMVTKWVMNPTTGVEELKTTRSTWQETATARAKQVEERSLAARAEIDANIKRYRQSGELNLDARQMRTTGEVDAFLRSKGITSDRIRSPDDVTYVVDEMMKEFDKKYRSQYLAPAAGRAKALQQGRGVVFGEQRAKEYEAFRRAKEKELYNFFGEGGAPSAFDRTMKLPGIREFTSGASAAGASGMALFRGVVAAAGFGEAVGPGYDIDKAYKFIHDHPELPPQLALMIALQQGFTTRPGTILGFGVDQRPEVIARSKADLDETMKKITTGNAWDAMDAVGAYGMRPFSEDSGAANTFSNWVLDPTNFVPMNILTYPARALIGVKIAREAAQAGSHIGVLKGIKKALTVTEAEIRLDKSVTKAIRDAGIEGEEQWARRIIHEVTQHPPKEWDKVAEKMLADLHFAERGVNSKQLVNLFQHEAKSFFEEHGIGFVDSSEARRAAGEADLEARAKAQTLAKEQMGHRAKVMEDTRKARAARDKDNLAAAKAMREQEPLTRLPHTLPAHQKGKITAESVRREVSAGLRLAPAELMDIHIPADIAVRIADIPVAEVDGLPVRVAGRTRRGLDPTGVPFDPMTAARSAGPGGRATSTVKLDWGTLLKGQGSYEGEKVVPKAKNVVVTSLQRGQNVRLVLGHEIGHHVMPLSTGKGGLDATANGRVVKGLFEDLQDTDGEFFKLVNRGLGGKYDDVRRRKYYSDRGQDFRDHMLADLFGHWWNRDSTAKGAWRRMMKSFWRAGDFDSIEYISATFARLDVAPDFRRAERVKAGQEQSFYAWMRGRRDRLKGGLTVPVNPEARGYVKSTGPAKVAGPSIEHATVAPPPRVMVRSEAYKRQVKAVTLSDRPIATLEDGTTVYLEKAPPERMDLYHDGHPAWYYKDMEGDFHEAGEIKVIHDGTTPVWPAEAAAKGKQVTRPLKQQTESTQPIAKLPRTVTRRYAKLTREKAALEDGIKKLDKKIEALPEQSLIATAAEGVTQARQELASIERALDRISGERPKELIATRTKARARVTRLENRLKTLKESGGTAAGKAAREERDKLRAALRKVDDEYGPLQEQVLPAMRSTRRGRNVRQVGPTEEAPEPTWAGQWWEKDKPFKLKGNKRAVRESALGGHQREPFQPLGKAAGEPEVGFEGMETIPGGQGFATNVPPGRKAFSTSQPPRRPRKKGAPKAVEEGPSWTEGLAESGPMTESEYEVVTHEVAGPAPTYEAGGPEIEWGDMADVDTGSAGFEDARPSGPEPSPPSGPVYRSAKAGDSQVALAKAERPTVVLTNGDVIRVERDLELERLEKPLGIRDTRWREVGTGRRLNPWEIAGVRDEEKLLLAAERVPTGPVRAAPETATDVLAREERRSEQAALDKAVADLRQAEVDWYAPGHGKGPEQGLAGVGHPPKGKPDSVEKMWSPKNFGYDRQYDMAAYVARDANGDVAGYMMLGSKDGVARYIDWVEVRPDLRRTGVGSRIYEAAQRDGVPIEELSGRSTTGLGAKFAEGRRGKAKDLRKPTDEGLVQGERAAATGGKLTPDQGDVHRFMTGEIVNEAPRPGEGSVLTSGTPPAEKGMVRLYRGRTDVPEAGSRPVPDWVAQTDEFRGAQSARGRWFTDTPERALDYVKSWGAGDYPELALNPLDRVTYVDLTPAEFEAFRVKNHPEALKYSRRHEEEWFVPREVADRSAAYVFPGENEAPTLTPAAEPTYHMGPLMAKRAREESAARGAKPVVEATFLPPVGKPRLSRPKLAKPQAEIGIDDSVQRYLEGERVYYAEVAAWERRLKDAIATTGENTPQGVIDSWREARDELERLHTAGIGPDPEVVAAALKRKRKLQAAVTQEIGVLEGAMRATRREASERAIARRGRESLRTSVQDKVSREELEAFAPKRISAVVETKAQAKVEAGRDLRMRLFNGGWEGRLDEAAKGVDEAGDAVIRKKRLAEGRAGLDAPLPPGSAWATPLSGIPLDVFRTMDEEVVDALAVHRGRTMVGTGQTRAGAHVRPLEQEGALGERDYPFWSVKDDEKAVLDAVTKKHGYTWEEYNAARTVLTPALLRQGRAESILKDVGEGNRAAFIAERTRRAVPEARSVLGKISDDMHVQGALPSDVINNFLDQMAYRGEQAIPGNLSAFQARTLGGAFEDLTGVKVADRESVQRVMKTESGRRPPMDDATAYRDYMIENGEWSPRDRAAFDRGERVHTLADARRYNEAAYADIPASLDIDEMERVGFFEDPNAQLEFMQRTSGRNPYFRDDAIRGLKGDEAVEAVVEGTHGLEPEADVWAQREFAARFYGERVARPSSKSPDGWFFHALPLLMDHVELAAFRADGIPVARLVETGVLTPDAVEGLRAAYRKELATLYGDYRWRLSGQAVDIKDVQKMSHRFADALMADKGWAKGTEFAVPIGKRALSAWSTLVRGSVTWTVAFFGINVLDPISKGAYGRWVNRGVSSNAITDVQRAWSHQDIAAEITQLHTRSQRHGLAKFRDPLNTRYYRDRIMGPVEEIIDLPATAGGKLETRIKRNMYEHFATGAYEDALGRGLSPIMAEAIARRFAKDEINRMFFPMLSSSPIYRLVNELFPFFNYQLRNKVFWLTEAALHPAVVRKLQLVGAAIERENLKRWAEENPEDPDGSAMPASQRHRILLPGTTDIWVDLSIFSDAGRALGLGTGSDKPKTMLDQLSGFFRLISPVPQAAANWLGAQAGMGSWKWVSDGTGSGRVRVWSPLGEPWSQDPVTLGSVLWPWDVADLVGKLTADGNFDLGDFYQLASKILFYSEFSKTNPVLMAQAIYFDLNDRDPKAAKTYLQRHPELQQYWDAGGRPREFMVPHELDTWRTALDPKSKDWYEHTPEWRAEVTRARNGLHELLAHWDTLIAPYINRRFDPVYRDLQSQRRAAIAAYYLAHPSLIDADASLKTTSEWQALKENWQNDADWVVYENLSKNRPFRADYATDAEFSKAYDAWQHEINTFLKASPGVAKDLAGRTDDYGRAANELHNMWGQIIDDRAWLHAATEHADLLDMQEAKDVFGSLDELIKGAGEVDMPVIAFEKPQLVRGLLERLTGRPQTTMLPSATLLPDYFKNQWDKAPPEERARLVRDAWYRESMSTVVAQAKAGGLFDPGKFKELVQANPRLMAQYFEKHPEKKGEWAHLDAYGIRHAAWIDMLTKAQKNPAYFAKANAYFDAWPGWMKQKYWDTHYDTGFKDFGGEIHRVTTFPHDVFEWSRGRQYGDFMSSWGKQLEKQDWDAARKTFESMPQWAQDRYFASHPGKKEQWAKSAEYIGKMQQWTSLIGKAVKTGNWDAANSFFDHLPQWMQDRYNAKHPDRVKRMLQNQAYLGYMGTWISFMSKHDWARGKAYFFSMPAWVRARYYSKPGHDTYLKGGRGGTHTSAYRNFMGGWVKLIKAGQSDKARAYFDHLPNWVKDRYYNDPKQGAKRRKTRDYIAHLEPWAKLLAKGDFDGARKVFDSFPQWVKDRYYNDPEKGPERRQTRDYIAAMQTYSKFLDKEDFEGARRFLNSQPKWVQDRYYNDPEKGPERRQNRDYGNAMAGWIALVDKGDQDGAQAYFDHLAPWIKDRYYTNHPEAKATQVYIGHMKAWTDLIAAKKFTEADAYFAALPKAEQDRYYAKHPEALATKAYIGHMEAWTKYLDRKDFTGAKKYFDSLPLAERERYFKKHPEHKGPNSTYVYKGKGGAASFAGTVPLRPTTPVPYSGRPGHVYQAPPVFPPRPAPTSRQSLNYVDFDVLDEYFKLDVTQQGQYLLDHPDLASWLDSHTTADKRMKAAISGAVSSIEDPWLRRIFKEKYPEVFDQQLKGEARVAEVEAKLAKHPELREAYERILEAIHTTYALSLRHHLQPKQAFLDAQHAARKRRHEVGRAASYTAARSRSKAMLLGPPRLPTDRPESASSARRVVRAGGVGAIRSATGATATLSRRRVM